MRRHRIPVCLPAALLALAAVHSPAVAQSAVDVPLPGLKSSRPPVTQAVGFSPKGTYLWAVVAADRDIRLAVWTAADRKLAWPAVPVWYDAVGEYHAAAPAWAADESGVAVLTTGEDRRIHLTVLDPKDGRPLSAAGLPAKPEAVLRMALAPDRKTAYLAVAEQPRDAKVVAVNAATGKEVFSFTPYPPGGAVSDLALSPDGKALATTGSPLFDPELTKGGSLKLWAAADGRPLGAGGTKSAAALRVTFAAGGRRLITLNTDKSIREWDAADPARPVPADVHADAVRLRALSGSDRWDQTGASADGRRVVVYPARWGGPAAVADLDGQRLLTPVTSDFEDGVAISPDGGRLASGGRSVRLWPLAEWEVTAADKASVVARLEADPVWFGLDARDRLAMARGETASLAPGGAAEEVRHRFPEGWVASVDFTAARYYLGAKDGVRVGRLTGGESELLVPADALARIGWKDAGRSSDARYAGLFAGRRHLFWKPNGGWGLFDDGMTKLAGEESGVPDEPGWVAAGGLLHLSGDKGLRTLDLKTGKTIDTVGWASPLVPGAVSPDGGQVYGTCRVEQSNVVLWRLDRKTGVVDHPIAGLGDRMRVTVTHMAAAAKAERLVVACYDRTLRVFDTRSWVCVGILELPGDPRGVALSADGKTAYAAVDREGDRRVLRWTLLAGGR